MLPSICSRMYSTTVGLVLLAISFATAEVTPTVGTYTRDNACIGGSLDLKSVPDNYPVNQNQCNIKYKKQEWQQQPKLMYPDAKKGSLYTLVMIDPDAPKLGDGEYYLHWLLTNVDGKDLIEGNLNNGDVVTSYVGPGPPKGTGDHKYQFLVYEQKNGSKDKTDFNKIPDDKRKGFNLEKWIKEQKDKAEFVGPLTGVQFLANYGE